MAITMKSLRDYSWMSQASYLSYEGFDKNTSDAIVQERLGNGLINRDKNFGVKGARLDFQFN